MADKRDRTLWYRIDYAALDQVLIDPADFAAHDQSAQLSSSIRTDCPDAVRSTWPDAGSTECPDVYKEQLLHTTTTSTTTLSVAPAPSAPEKIASAKESPAPVLSVSAKTEEAPKEVVRQVRRSQTAGSQAAAPATPALPPIAAAPLPAPAKPAKTKKPRERDPFMDAIALACYGDLGLTKTEWRTIGMVKSELSEVGMTPEDVATLIAWMRLDKYWQSRPILPVSLSGQVSKWRMALKTAGDRPQTAAEVVDSIKHKYGGVI